MTTDDSLTGISRQIDDARSLPALAAAACRIDEMIVLLQGGGFAVEQIANRVSELNARLFARLWSQLAGTDLVANSCLLVMGSEGRGEQILKTDQDNALLLRDGFVLEELADVTSRFSAALSQLGYPPCPGQIMLSNPLWRQSLSGFCEALRHWVYGADPEGPMRLAIFFDAVPVAGDARLLTQAREFLDRILVDNDAFLARFARAADQFSESSGWWGWLTSRRDERALDLKKLGTFPIVHGVRALALRHGVRAVGTVARLNALVERGHFDSASAGDLTHALHFIMALKLEHQLAQRQRGVAPDNLVRRSEFDPSERERLEQALAVIRRFRSFLRRRFRIDSL